MITPNGQAALSCNRVFNIPELLAQIAFHLNNDNDSDNGGDSDEKARSLRVLVNVCRLWHSLFAPYAWKEVTLPGPPTHKRLSGLLRYRTHIQTLTCNVVTKKTLKTLTRPHNESTKTKNNCNNELTNLKTLHLTLDRHSIWISYTHLETFFLQTSHNSIRLSTVSIKFDSTVLDTRLLWSLSQLPFLEDLRLETVRYNHRALGLNDLCREILVCCRGLRSFRMESGYTYRDYVPKLVRWKVGVVGKVARRVGGWMPDCVEDAVARRGHGGLLTISKDRDLSSSTAQQQPQELGSVDSPLILKADKNNNNNGHIISNSIKSKCRSRSNLRRLQLRHCSFDTLVFSDVIKQTSQLEELDLQTLFYRGSSDIMGIVTRHCRHLRTLRLSGRNEGMSIEAIGNLLLGLPRLEEFFMVLNNSELPAWQSLDTHLLREHERNQEHDGGRRHPLKTLSIKGYYKETLSTLLEILSLNSLSLSTLTIGSPWFFQIFMEHTPGNLYSPFAPLVERQTPSRNLFSRPWSMMKDSLVRLDISTTILVDREVARKVFLRLQELKALKGLYVSARHVKDWFPKNFIVTLPPPLSPRQTDNNHSNNSTGNSGSIGYMTIDRAYITQHLPTGTHCFPCLQDMIIQGEDRNVPVPFEITAPEAVFLIAAMPCLEYLYLKRGSVGEKTLNNLKGAFPEYFGRIPKDRVDWIDERFS